MSNYPIRIFVGFDPSESIAYHVCCQSILEHASQPVSFIPIGLMNVPKEYKRPRGPKDSTEFAITRFLVPWFCDFKGIALFVDGDMIIRADVSKIFEVADRNKAVSVVKHDYVPKSEKKFLNQNQTKYRRKNWSSVMLFNNEKCKALDIDYIMSAHGLDLHQFKWINDEEIGTLEMEWNHLVGEYPLASDAKNLHYTLGGPYFPEYRNTDNAEDWFEMCGRAMRPMVIPE